VLNSRSAARLRLRPWLPDVLSASRFTRLALDIAGCAVATGVSIRDITLDASRVASHTRQLCAFPWWFGHVAEARRLLRLEDAEVGYQNCSVKRDVIDIGYPSASSSTFLVVDHH